MVGAGDAGRLTAADVAALVGGELVGSADVAVAGVASLEEAGPGDVAFLASSRWLPYFRSSRAGAVLVTPAFRNVSPGPRTRIVVADPRQAARQVLARLAPAPRRWGVEATARLGRRVRWSGRITVGAHAVVGDDVEFGADCVVGAHAYVAPRTRIGHRVVIGPGARVGTPGFAHLDVADEHLPVPHAGACEIGDDVTIGANTTVDRGSVGATTIGAGTKVDNLVQIGHNVRVGRRCLIMAQVGIAGTTAVGNDVMLAGQAGLAGQLTVGDGARIAAQAGVIGDVAAGATVSGYPARDHRRVLRQTAALARLAPLVPTLERLAASHASSK